MSIEEIDTRFLKGKNRCKYSEHYKRCLPIKIIKLKTEIDNLNNQIYHVTDNLEAITNREEIIQTQEDELLLLRHELESNNNRLLNIESYRSEDTIKEQEEDIYQYHYYRIDKYLENIKHLPFKSFYTSLSLLLDKYGRNGSEIDGENHKYYYSRPGNKKIICHHHSYFIDYNNKILTFSEALNKVTEEYGVENEGYIWCRNCGERINGSEYETQEAFLDSGARDVTHEVIEEEEEYKSEENSELIEVLRKSLLYGDDKSIENQGLSIIKIISVLTNIMGITLSNADELAMITLSNEIEFSKIKTKSSWIQFAKKKQKKASLSFLENAYNSYRIRTIILYTTSILFLFVQSGIPEYTVTKTFSNCKPSLRGYPLDKIYKQEGIDYMVCVLNSLSSLGVDWSSLKKIKIKDNLIKKIDEFYIVSVIKYRYDIKKKYLIEQNIEATEYSYEWNEFRPPLDPFELEIKELKSYKNIEKFIKQNNSEKVNSELQKMHEFEKTISLKLIEEIDIQIMENDIVNKKYTPTPLDNLCCLQNINSSYNYMSYFVKKNKVIQELIEIIHSYNKNKQHINNLLKGSKIFIRSELQTTLISFNRNIGIDKDELTEDDIQNLYYNFIDKGFFEGQKHIYEQNYCILTGETKNEILSKKYKKDDYYDLLNKVNKKKMFYIEKTVYQEIEDKITHVINSNIYLQNNDYLNSFNEKLKKNKNKKLVWDDMKEQIQTEAKEISNQLGIKLNISNTDNIKNILLFLGEKRNVLENDIKLMTEKEAYNKFFIDKINLIQSFILNYLKNTIFKIKNNKNIAAPYIPEEWNLDARKKNDKVLIDKYTNIILDNNKNTEKFLHLSQTHAHIFEKIEDILKGTTNNIKILIGSGNINICETQNSVDMYSNISYFLHYIFLHILSEILETDHDTLIEDSEFIIDTNDYEEDEFNISRDITQTNEIEAQIISDILTHIEKDSRLLDKHTPDYIKSVIEKKGETLKEETLRFVQELDKETWASLRMRISIGLDSWSSLSSKNKEIYTFDKNIGEDENIQTNSDIVEQNQLKARKELGDNYSDEQYQQWISNTERNNNEDSLAYQERDIMSDDDGDDY